MKRTIYWIIPLGILVALGVYYWPQEEITDNEFIEYVQTTTYNETTYAALMDNNCSEKNWVYFATNKRQDVVEFKGTCSVDGEDKKMNVQFLVDSDMTTVDVGAMLIANEKVEEKKRDATLAQFNS
ncbi:MAG: glucosamine 6-phosphate synthetase [Caryophanon sp.]|nr:glucosamine 6-phosphate synthetase [Caryophanon sp.]